VHDADINWLRGTYDIKSWRSGIEENGGNIKS
jgi:hypothetical protein